MKEKLVVLSGAGISAESGIRTFRDMGGMWEEYDVMEVCSPDGWSKNNELVLDFYNQRRKQLATVKPNEAHLGLKALEKYYDVEIITQNVDNLHEVAGSKVIHHLHGELTKARSVSDRSDTITDIGYDEIKIGDKASDGLQLRPHIVWFGEAVPMMDVVIPIVKNADIFVVIGTSLNVYPAAGLLNYAGNDTRFYLIDPGDVEIPSYVTVFKENASTGIKKLMEELCD
ncbi:NAD-dependent deacylase [Bacteroidales bacterium]|nr:NAD-dependent deacylase [Bacteroidales bacterium]